MFKSLLLFTTILVNSTVLTLDNRFTWSNYAMKSFKSRQKTEQRIVGGTSAEDNLAPYMVELEDKYFGTGHMCGGSLIASRTVITAGHCCDPFKTKDRIFHVKFDGIDRSKLKQKRNIVNLVTHPLYTWSRENPSDYDYCIVHLDSEVIPSETVKFIRIADELPVDGDRVLALGWGREEFTSSSAYILKQATLSIIDNTKCKLKYDRPVRDRYICVSEPGVATCFVSFNLIKKKLYFSSKMLKGDSGGPLVFRKRLVGVLSFGNFHDCVPGHISSYSNVTVVKEWIEDNII